MKKKLFDSWFHGQKQNGELRKIIYKKRERLKKNRKNEIVEIV